MAGPLTKNPKKTSREERKRRGSNSSDQSHRCDSQVNRSLGPKSNRVISNLATTLESIEDGGVSSSCNNIREKDDVVRNSYQFDNDTIGNSLQSTSVKEKVKRKSKKGNCMQSTSINEEVKRKSKKKLKEKSRRKGSIASHQSCRSNAQESSIGSIDRWSLSRSNNVIPNLAYTLESIDGEGSRFNDDDNTFESSLQSMSTKESFLSNENNQNNNCSRFFRAINCGKKKRHHRRNREMASLLRSRSRHREGIDDIMEHELKVQERNHYVLLLSCVLICIICGVLFLDQIPPLRNWGEILLDHIPKAKYRLVYNAVDDDKLQDESNVVSIPKNHLTTKPTTQAPSKATPVPVIHQIQEHTHSNFNQENAFAEQMEMNMNKLVTFLKWNVPFSKISNIPFYWLVPLSGSTEFNNILGNCVKLVQAAGGHLSNEQVGSEVLSVITQEDGEKFVNVDLDSVEGIKDAKRLGLVNSNLADVIRTSHIYEGAGLFESTGKYAKCFTFVRNPIARAISMFEFSKFNAENNPTDENSVFIDMTINEYVHGSFCEDNWMVRFLSNELSGPLTASHLSLAKDVLGRKCLVGLTSDFEESIRRLTKYFHWDNSPIQLANCMRDMHLADNNGEEENDVLYKDKFSLYSPLFHKFQDASYRNEGENNEVWNMLEKKNHLDMEFFNYAVALFNKQAIYGQRQKMF